MVMSIEQTDTIIVGGGLSGIYAAWLLARTNRSFILLEGRDRAGGRILSPGHEGFCADLGPSWFWPQINPNMVRLVETFGLSAYRQFEDGMGRFQRHSGKVLNVRGYPMEPLSFRISGGMMALIGKLCESIPRDAVRLNHPVCGIERKSDGVLVSIGELEEPPIAQLIGKRAILALPPRLAASTILFTPDLSFHLTQAMLKTGTWMAGQAKFCAFYEEPFWRRTGLSGQGFSERGPLGEIHDGSNNGGAPYGLTGFLGIPAVQRNHKQLLVEAAISQLAAMFGKKAERPTAFFYQDWAKERFTATELDLPPMLEHPLYHPPADKTAIWDGAVLFAGTETADRYGGYLEGALNAARRAIMGR